MKIVFDSSSLVKRYIEEVGSQFIDGLLETATEFGLSVLCVPEVSSALNRRVREGKLPPTDYETIKQHLLADAADATMLDLTPVVIIRSLTLLENNPLRAMDALHIACALVWKADLFVSSDERQLSAAQHHGLITRRI